MYPKRKAAHVRLRRTFTSINLTVALTGVLVGLKCGRAACLHFVI